MQRLARLFFPPQCLCCGEMVQEEFALCGPCRREAWFIAGLVCDACGTPLVGEEPEGSRVLCDDCLTLARPWHRGRAVLLYRGTGRSLVLALKHADRTDLARPLSGWMAKAAAPIFETGMLVVPVPLHRRRFFKRRYNQAALLSRGVARHLAAEICPDALIRPKQTAPQDGMGVEARFANMEGKITVHPRRKNLLTGRAVLLIDDVMTSGATLSVAAEACFAAGAASISVLTLARVAKDT